VFRFFAAPVIDSGFLPRPSLRGDKHMKLSNLSLKPCAILAALAAIIAIAPAFAQDTIVNQDIQPVPIHDVNPPGAKPFQYSFSVLMGPGKYSSDSLIDFNQSAWVLVGRMYVVEHVAFQGSCSGGASPNIAYGLHVKSVNIKDPSTVEIPLIVAGKASGLTGPDSFDVYGSAPMHQYLTVGTILSGVAARDGGVGTCAGNITVTGYAQTGDIAY
jgi:hypothetical protein